MKFKEKPRGLKSVEGADLNISNFNNLILENFNVNGHSTLNLNYIRPRPYTIRNCFFAGDLRIDGVFTSDFQITDCYIAYLEISINHAKSITLSNCSIDTLTIVGGDSLFDLTLNTISENSDEPNCFIRTINFDINTCRINFEKVNFENAKIKLAQIENSSSEISISNCNANEGNALHYKEIRDSIYKLMEDKNEVKSTLEIYGYTKFLVIQNSILTSLDAEKLYQPSISIINSIIKVQAAIKCHVIQSFKIQNSQLTSLLINSLTLIYLEIINDFKGSLFVKTGNLNNVKIFKNDGGTLCIYKLDLSNCVMHNLVEIQDCIIENLNLNQFGNPKGNLIFKRCQIRQTISMINSSIGKSSFNNVNFDKNLTFKFLNSEIIDSKFLTVDWMNKHRLDEELPSNIMTKQDKLQHYLTVKESYRQLKEISLKALNRYDALNFQRNEQRMYKEILWIKRNYIDHFLLKTNDVFNDFGLSYIKPLFWLLSMHLVLFCLVMSFGDNILPYTFSLFSGTFSWSETLKAFSQYFQTLIPIHNADYLGGKLGFPLIIDILMRISSGYFIYYLISASRKFHINS